MSISDSIVCPQCQERAPADYVVCPYCGYSLIKIVRERTRVHVGFGQAIGRIRRLIADPMHTPEVMREIGLNPDRKGGLMIAFLISYFLLELVAIVMFRSYPGGLEPLFALGLLITFPLMGSLILLFLVYLVWWIFGLTTWLIARLIGGKGSRGDTSGVVGYGMLPLALGFLVADLLMFILAPTPGEDDTFQDVLRDVDTGFVGIILLPFIVWTAYIVGLGIENVHSLDRTYSFAISGVIAAIFYGAFIVNII